MECSGFKNDLVGFGNSLILQAGEGENASPARWHSPNILKSLNFQT
jgi:hypothetical protein